MHQGIAKMTGWVLDLLMAFVGLAHALASWLYFARVPNARWWVWSLCWILATAGCIAAAQSLPWLGYGLFVGVVALLTVWWATMRASSTRDWVPENRYQATGAIDGQTLTVQNVRNFDWKSKRAYDARWVVRSYDLRGLQSVELFLCTWGNPSIAHVTVSFDFANGPPLCFYNFDVAFRLRVNRYDRTRFR